MRLRYLYRAFKTRYRDQSEELLTSLVVICQGDTVAKKPEGDRFWNSPNYCNNRCFAHPEAKR